MAVTLKETVQDFLTPREYLEDVFAINLDSLENNGIKLLLIDVNNTIMPAEAEHPSLRIIHWFEQLKNYSFQTVLISGGWDKGRLAVIAKTLNVPVYYGLLKPALTAVKTILAKYAVSPAECVIVGDALWSDVLLAKLLGAYSILVKNCDQPLELRGQISLLRRAKGLILENIINNKIN